MKWFTLIFLLCLFSMSCLPTRMPIEFASLAELEEFLANDNTDKIINEKWCCLDYARQLQTNAFIAGWIINIQVIGKKGEHVINLCIINDVPYFIDPCTDRIFQLGELDFPR